jgi:hypothetical protein
MLSSRFREIRWKLTIFLLSAALSLSSCGDVASLLSSPCCTNTATGVDGALTTGAGVVLTGDLGPRLVTGVFTTTTGAGGGAGGEGGATTAGGDGTGVTTTTGGVATTGTGAGTGGLGTVGSTTVGVVLLLLSSLKVERLLPRRLRSLPRLKQNKQNYKISPYNIKFI